MLMASLNKVLEPDCSNIHNDANGGIECCNEENLMERVRLALLRLPTDATITSSVTASTAIAAWRHVKEMILECCRNWEKNDVTVSMLLTSSTSLEKGDNELISKHGILDVVDWALTSWTALLLSQGVDCFASTSSSTPSQTRVTLPCAEAGGR